MVVPYFLQQVAVLNKVVMLTFKPVLVLLQLEAMFVLLAEVVAPELEVL